jgi:ZIP family zinc transporter
MDINWFAVGATLVAGLSTGLGALPVLFKKEFSKGALDLGMGFSAGVMLVASFIALILPGLEEGRQIYGQHLTPLWVLGALFIGYLFIVGVHKITPHIHLGKKEKGDEEKGRKLSRVWLVILAIALHNIPEGLTVGVGFGSGEDVSGGMALAIAISIQNMPEGLVVAFGLLREGATRRRAFSMALLSGLIEPVAALLGFLSTKVSSYSLPLSLGFAGGAMLFVTCQEIFPELFREGHEKKATLGVVSGIMGMLLIDYYLA